jgi:Flp pilus assembly protein TadG
MMMIWRNGQMDSSAEKSTSAQPGKGRGGLLRHFRRDSRGNVAIEFGALAIPFAMLVFAILESSISFAAQQLMSNVTDDVARQIRTGQLRPVDLEDNKLHDKICEKLEILVSNDCPGLEVDLRTYTTFAQAAAARINLTVDNDIDTSDFKVEPGTSLSKNQLRVFYRWPVMTDFLRKSMSNLKDGKTLHFATVTWQNEPFDD